MANGKRDYSTGFTLSRGLSILTRHRANQLALLSALDSRGALWRVMRIPGLRLVSALTGWWSRGWVGQKLGIAWCVAILLKGIDNKLDPTEPGDEWETFKDDQIPKPKR